jgi:hypothetical protein
MKLWFLNKMICFCDYGLRFSSGADDQSEINEMVKMKNYFISERDKL